MEQCVKISSSIPEANGHLARAKFELGQIYANLGYEEQGQKAKLEARQIRSTIGGIHLLEDDTIKTYDKLVPWMLW